MNHVTDDVRLAAKRFAHILHFEPGVRPDFSYTDLDTLVGVIAALIARGVDTLQRIHSYLQHRNCPFPQSTIEFLLNQYDGGDRRHSLWRRNRTGRYSTL